MPTPMPGRDVITEWANRLAFPIDRTMANADMLLAPDPDAMMVGGDQVGSIMANLQTSGRDAAQVGTDVLPGWSGASADQMVPTMATLGQRTQQTTDLLAATQKHLASIAEDSANRINAVCNASAITAAFLRTQQIAATPPITPGV